MGRPIIVSDDTFIEQINLYRSEYPRIKIKYSEIERYCRNNGLTVKDGTVKKRTKIVAYIKKLNAISSEECKMDVGAYVPLDIVELLDTHKSKTEIKSILRQREIIFQHQSLSLMKIIEERNSFENKYNNLKSENKALKAKIEKLENKNETIASKDILVGKYKDVVDKFIYPEIALMLLDKDYKSEILDTDNVNEVTVHSKDNVYEDDELNSLMGEFDD